MSANTPAPKNLTKAYLEIERKVINLMLRHCEVTGEMVTENINPDFFDERHKPLVQAIYYTHGISEGKRLLTDDHYRNLLIEQGGKGDIAIPMQVYHACLYGVHHSNSKNDFDLLKKQLVNSYVHRRGIECLDKFNQSVGKMGYVEATKQYIEDLSAAVNLIETKKSMFMIVDELQDRYTASLTEKKEDIEPKIECGIPEIDDAMNVGFKAGHTSLYVAATGGHKCLAHYEKCILEGGSWIAVSELQHRIHGGEKLTILSYNEQNGELYYQPVQEVIDNGDKACLRIATSLGFSVDVTDNHPFLQSHGYEEAGKLEVGEHVGIVKGLVKRKAGVDRDSLAEYEVLWDKIVSIESVGKHKTYDIAMPVHHNFVTNGFITHNTNMMLNVALNIFQKGHNVLFLPLEMDWQDFVTRMISNVSGVTYQSLLNPKQMTAEDFKKVKEARTWISQSNKFALLDVDEQISISVLRRELERRANYFAPKVVVVDYLGLLKTQSNFGQRHDLALGELTKSLKFLGKKYGFHVITAAQLGRADIRRLREEGSEAHLDSTSVKGSQEVSSDVEFIFALTTPPDEDDRLKFHVIKARYGASGYTKDLRVEPHRCRIYSMEQGKQTPAQAGDALNDEEWNLKLNEPVEEIVQKIKEVKFKSMDDNALDDIIGM